MRLPTTSSGLGASEMPYPARYPWWLADLGASTPCPPMTGDDGADVVIVGGGYTGLWTPLTLKHRDPDTDVMLLEAGTCGWAASGRNGGSVHGYWSAWPKLPSLVGTDAAVELGELGSIAQEEIRAFCADSPVPTQMAEDGFAMVATSRAQHTAVDRALASADRLPAAHRPRRLAPDELRALTGNSAITHGLLHPEGATVHPARLVHALKSACLDAGVRVHESSEVGSVDPETATVHTATGRVRARDVVLATNAWMSALAPVAPFTTNLSSHVAVTEPMPDVVAGLSWPRGRMVRDARMFLHWVRIIDGDRFVVGTGAGPLAHGGRVTRAHSDDPASVDRVTRVLSEFVPEAAHARFAAAWGGAIDLSSDNVPWFGTVPGGRVHYGSGYSGHGVNAAWIGGQVLASLATRREDRWTTSAFCTRSRPRLPPEPLRYLGGAAIRRHTLTLEDALDADRSPSAVTRAVTALPSLLGIRIGTR